MNRKYYTMLILFYITLNLNSITYNSQIINNIRKKMYRNYFGKCRSQNLNLYGNPILRRNLLIQRRSVTCECIYNVVNSNVTKL